MDDARYEKIMALRTKFVTYGAAAEALKILEEAYHQPRTIRPRNCLILGNGNNGKSSILTEFASRYPGSDCEAAEAVDFPILNVMAPPEGQLRTLYINILQKLGNRHANNILTSDLYGHTTRMIQACGVKMVLLDEFHNILINGRIQKNSLNFLNQFRYMLNDWCVPVVCSGTPEDVATAISTIDQVSTRFNQKKWIMLPDWTAGSTETKKLLKSLGDLLPLKNSVDLTHKELRYAIIKYSKGRLGDIVDIVIDAATDALNGSEQITPERLHELNTRPSPLKKAA